MTNKPSVEVVATPHFARVIKRLRKKYAHIQDDLTPIINALQSGDQLQGVGFPSLRCVRLIGTLRAERAAATG